MVKTIFFSILQLELNVFLSSLKLLTQKWDAVGVTPGVANWAPKYEYPNLIIFRDTKIFMIFSKIFSNNA